jgi:hypothetical protein
MKRAINRLWMIGSVVGIGVAALLARPQPVEGFTQSGGETGVGAVVPIGHEWITRMAALEVLGDDPVMTPDPNDPRKTWTKGKAKNTSLAEARGEVGRIKDDDSKENRYASTYEAVFSAILGERWVDLGGFNFIKAKYAQYNCLDNITQLPAEVQYDHFMRRWDDVGGAGGVNAAKKSRERFIAYFVAAAKSPRGILRVWDGGAYSSEVTVDRNYFLFGRAAHLFQDAFSSEHVVRTETDNYERVRQVKSYHCAAGAEQHSHDQMDAVNYEGGDVIWKTRTGSGFASYKASAMKVTALVATEAMKDMWAAFIRVMEKGPTERERAAQAEARTLADNWLSFDENEMLHWYENQPRDKTYVLESAAGAAGAAGKAPDKQLGQTQATCLASIKGAGSDLAAYAKSIETLRRTCLYNIEPMMGFADAADASLGIPFHWAWKDSTWLKPPKNWVFPGARMAPEIKIKLRSVQNRNYVMSNDVEKDNWVFAKPGDPLEWIVVGDKTKAYLRVATAPLFLSYRYVTGAVKFHDTAVAADFQIKKLANGKYALYNRIYEDYVWVSGEDLYLTGSGDPKNANAQFEIEGLPADW